ncbi:MAG: hypothetical protein ACQER9_01440 [Nanobdellota archaeon]
MDNEILRWAKLYIKQRDVLKKEISEIEDNGDNEFIVKKKDSNDFSCFASKEIDVGLIKDKEDFWYVTQNKKKNIDILNNNWNLFLKKNGKVVFIDLQTGFKWIINIKAHSMIIKDDEQLKKSLQAMYKNSKSE